MLRAVRALPLGKLTKISLSEPTVATHLAFDTVKTLVERYGEHLAAQQPVHAFNSLSLIAHQLPPITIEPGLPLLHFEELIPTWLVHSVQILADCGGVLAHVANDVAFGLHSMTIAIPILRLINWYFHTEHYATHPSNIHRQSKLLLICEDPTLGQIQSTYTEIRNIRSLQTSNTPVPVGLPSHVPKLLNLANDIGSMQGTAPALHTALSNEISNMHRQLHSRKETPVPDNAQRGFEKLLAEFAPEYNFRRYTKHHPHPECAMARKISLQIVAAESTKTGQVNTIVGGSPYQVSAFPQTVHNCAPRLSGRDVFRHEFSHSLEEREFSRKISCQDTFQHCQKAIPSCNTIIPLVPDLSVEDALRGMMAKGSSQAFVITHLPIPFLDNRIDTWTDDELRVRFERDGKGKILMYHIDTAGAGYANDENAMLSWARPAPVIPGFDVTIEELRHIGSMYILHLKIVRGKGEDKPSLFKVASGKFYLLPLLVNPVRAGKDAQKYFVVPAVRFDNITKFAAISTTPRNAFEVVGNKVRGQEAEIKVADKVILARWELTSDEFNSVVTHAIIRAEILRRDNDHFATKGLTYVKRWYDRTTGSLAKRYLRGLWDTITLSQLHRSHGMFEDDLLTRALNWFFNTEWHHHSMEDPYAEHGVYRLLHDQSRGNSLHWLNHCFSQKSVTYETEQYKSERPGDFLCKITYADCRNTNAPSQRRITQKELLHLEGLAILETTALPPPQSFHTSTVEEVHRSLKSTVMKEEPAGKHDLTSPHLMPERSVPDEVKREQGETPPATVTGPPSIIETLQKESALAELVGEVIAGPPSLVSADSETTNTLSQAISFTPTDSSKDTIASLPKLETPCQIFRVSQHQVDKNRAHDGQIHFAGPISFLDGPNPTPSQRKFSTRFTSSEQIKVAIENEEFKDEPIPDTGCSEYVNLILKSYASTNGKCAFNPENEILDRDHSGSEEDSIKEHVNKFWEHIKRSFNRHGDNYRRPSLLIDGLAASAKSRLIRDTIDKRSALVVVPTKQLKGHWRQESRGLNVVTITQHELPKGTDRYDWLVIDEANCFSREHLKAWFHLANRLRVDKVICVADCFQKDKRKETDAQFHHSPLIAPSIRMTHTFGMPVDALSVFLLCNGLEQDPSYFTLSKVHQSIYLVDREVNDAADFPRLELYTRARLTAQDLKDPYGNLMCSVTQSQGLRCRTHYFGSGLSHKQHRWFRNMPAIQSVLFSRHTEKLILDMTLGDAADAFVKVQFEAVPVINGDKTNAQLVKNRYRRPHDLDTIIVPYASQNETFNHAAWSLDLPGPFGDRLISTTGPVDPTTLESANDIGQVTSLKFANEVINPRTQHISRREYKEHLDLITEAAHGLISCSSEIGFGDEPKLKSHIPGVSALGDIQMARDRYHDLRNLIIRQLNEPKKLFLTAQDISDAKELFDNYVQGFCKDEYQFHAVNNFGYDYISSRTPTFIKTWDDPFGFAANSLSRNSFLKTQVKVKPGLNGAETHGQTVIANEASMTNTFGAYARLGYYGMAQMDRDDFLTDTGFSDDELSQLLKERGIGARIEAHGNLQIDLTRQDSTHRPSHVLAYAMFLEFCNVPREICDLYVMLRSLAYVKSLAEGLYKAIIKWNLGSGDPFTLNANCFMMKSTLAVRYTGLRYCAGIQKGDDFTCSNEGWKISSKAGLYSRLKVQMKIDVNKPPYHAGRFIKDSQVLADPVRAFFRHFAKTHDPKATLEEIYTSFCDRKIHYTEEQSNWLKAIIPLFYPDVNSEEAIYIVDVILSLRSFKCFKSTYKYADRCENDIFDPPEDCAFLVARRLKPSLSISTLRSLRNHHDRHELLAAYRALGISSMLAAHPSLVPRGFTGAVITAKHVYGMLPPTPHL
jgi:hypothetical protein